VFLRVTAYRETKLIILQIKTRGIQSAETKSINGAKRMREKTHYSENYTEENQTVHKQPRPQ
jgi:hypothetical protein